MQLVSWAAVKYYLDSTLESARYTVDDSFYYIFAGSMWCKISLTLPGDAADLTDWETNYQPLANVISNEIKIRGGTDGTIIGNAGDRLKLDVVFSADQLIKVSPDDLTAGYLEAKVLGTANKIVVSTANPGGSENLQVDIGSDVFDKSSNTTDNITEGVTNLFFTNERAQDAVGATLTDTTTIDFTYNDAGNTITADLKNTTVTPTSYGSATAIPTFTVDAQGRLTDASTVSLTTLLNASSATSVTNTTTTSGTDVLINSMTITPTSGTYLVFFSTYLESNSTNSDIAVTLYSGGVAQAHSERRATPQFSSGGLGGAPSLYFPIATNTLVTVNGSQAIEARWRRSAGTASCTFRTLTIFKVG